MNSDGWMDIETAPKDGTIILVGHLYAVFDAEWHAGENAWVDGATNMYDDLIHYEPTHWMPLPAPPTYKAKSE